MLELTKQLGNVSHQFKELYEKGGEIALTGGNFPGKAVLKNRVGETPMQTFLDAKPISEEKMISCLMAAAQSSVALPDAGCQIKSWLIRFSHQLPI